MSRQKFTLRSGSHRIVGFLDRPRAQHWMPVFLFLHGQTSTKEDPFAVALTQQFVRQGIAVCRIDLPGHGESSGDVSTYTYSRSLAAVEATVAWLQRQGFRRIAVGGHSLGGGLSYLLASRTSGIRTIVSLSGVTDPWRVHRGLYSAQALKNLSRLGYADRISSHGKPFRQTKAFFDDLQQYRSFSTVAKNIHCPTLVIHGSEDDVVTMKQVKQFYNNLSGVDDGIKALIPLRGVGHDLREPRVRDAVIHLMLQWLARYLFPEETPVVDIFVYHKGKILLVKRSQRVGAHQGLWHVPAGFLVPGKNILTQARLELREEVGLNQTNILSMRLGTVLRRVDEKVQRVWVVNTVVVESRTSTVRLNWEHDAARWVSPAALSKYPLIPGVRNLIAENPPR